MRKTMIVSTAVAAATALTVGVLAATAGNGTTMTTATGMHTGHAMRATTAATVTASDLRSTLGRMLASTPRSR